VTVVAAPVLARLGPGCERRADGRRRFEVDGFVVVVTPPGTPWLPNGIALGPGPTVVWDPVLPAMHPGPALARRGRDVLAALGPFALAGGGAAAPPAAAFDALLDALRTGDSGHDAAAGLLGRGAGLTPEGDDLLAGACAVAAAAGVPLALPPDLRERTTALSATLLELAASGAAPRPLHAVLDLSSGDWRGALTDLVGLGASSGRAIALGAGAAAALIRARGRVRPRTARHYVA
jgi:uncharacterized protein DUF2877